MTPSKLIAKPAAQAFPFRFKLEAGTRSTAPHAPCVRVFFKDTCIAITDTPEEAREYVSVYGPWAEWRRQWNLGNPLGWDETIRLYATSPKEAPNENI